MGHRQSKTGLGTSWGFTVSPNPRGGPPAYVIDAPSSPPMSACDELDGMP